VCEENQKTVFKMKKRAQKGKYERHTEDEAPRRE